MYLKSIEKTWNKLGKTDPLWAILARRGKSQNRWDIGDFFETGITEVENLMKYIYSLNIDISRNKCLDFGCGVGRMTQALALYFNQVHGVDISLPMINLAKEHNRRQNCYYHSHRCDDLGIFSENYFDLVVSYLTLFHIYPKYTKRYLTEVLRVLHPGGVAVFHIVNDVIIGSYKEFIKVKYPGWSRFLLKIMGKYRDISMYGVYCIKHDDLVDLVRGSGGKIIDRQREEVLGRNYICYRYCVIKNKTLNHAARDSREMIQN
jgi:2-polyprenyl-3-methyl-5-hydroxy-6-metoxy-1,4-benzoquinol methylase